MIDIQTMVRREVHYCVSSLISEIAKGYGGTNEELGEMAESAFELCRPIEDFEEAATQAGWQEADNEADVYLRNATQAERDAGHMGELLYADSWQQACEIDDLEPYEWEVFEHWIVSDWLADKLEAKGERVEKDFWGLTVWGRTTTGQAIYMDSVIEAIYADMMKPEESAS